MTDFVNKVITLVLIFVMLVLAPLLISYMSTDMITERLVLNDVSQFIDKVTDKSLVSEHDLDSLYLAVNSHGQAYNVTVKKYQVLEEENPTGGELSTTKLIYVNMDELELLTNGTLVYTDQDAEVKEGKIAAGVKKDYVDLEPRDVIKVHVEEVSMSPGKRLFWTLLRVDKGPFEFSLAGTVR